MYCPEKKVLFYLPMKTATCSLVRFLQTSVRPRFKWIQHLKQTTDDKDNLFERLKKHMVPSEVKTRLDISKYHKIMMIRNIWDMYVSYYFWLKTIFM